MTFNSSTDKSTIANTPAKTIVQSLNVEITKCIFEWQMQPAEHYREIGTSCHCLLRIFDFKTEARAVIIASSLWSNHDNRGIWSEPESFVREVFDRFNHLQSILPNCSLIIHSGQFSHELAWAETFHRDRFDTISVALNHQNLVEIDEQSEIELSAKEVKDLLNQMLIEPVTEILRQLEHDNGWGGVVNDKQIKACWELENGIAFEPIAQTRLVG